MDECEQIFVAGYLLGIVSVLAVWVLVAIS